VPAAPRTGEETTRWTFDWRELERWGLDPSRLPAGSDVRYRVAPAWERYRWHMAAAGVVLTLQTGLIAGLLVARARRRRAERALAERVSFDDLLAELSSVFNARPTPAVDPTVERALRRIVHALGVDRVTLGELSLPARGVAVTHVATAPGIARVPGRLGPSEFPWTAARLGRGEVVHFARLAELPADAAVDRQSYVRYGTRSLVAVPLVARGAVIGTLSLSAMTAERAWPADLLERLHLLAEIFAGALLQRRAEAALRESEERFQLMADHAPVMVWMSDADMRCTYVNRRWLEFTGRRVAQELGDGWLDSIHEADRGHCAEAYRRAFAIRGELLMEYRLRRKDGEYRSILDQGVPRIGADGTFAGFVGSCVDVTDLRAAERALLESKLLGAAIFTSLHGQVAALDARGAIIAVNDAWVRDAADRGADPARVSPGASYLDECRRALDRGDPQAKHALEAIEAVLAGHRPHATVEYVSTGPGDRRWFQMLVEPLRRPEGGAVVSHIDVTDRRRAEDEARRRRQELAHAQRLSTTGELAASLAHEINQPLLAIMSNAQAADRLLGGPVPDLAEARAALDDIAADANRAAEVIRALRGMVGKDAAPHGDLDVNELVARVARLVRHEVERREITLRVDLGSDVPAVRGDAVQLQQVVLNLLLNASDAIAGEGTAARDIRLATWRTAAGDARIDVVDTGPGVPEDQLERMFSPFVTSKPDGLGLGLSISRSIVEAHGGRIGAASNAGRGLTVSVVLPRAARAVAA
jgi:two-component system sensor kinase FixL